ncbi:NAD(P)/FAD-dependent oxidoreductase [Streptomyces griseoviridis]|uniref:FAD-dependent oxidoreductase n=1 Tax=Streptomyces griseoviridis TaxID=45398 RepID=UPI0033E7B44C
MRALVIGGGIAGTATALGLHRAGVDVEVYEAHPDAAEDIGAFLTLASNGMRALVQLDAATAVGRAGFPLTSMRVLDASGAEVGLVPLGEAADPVLRYRCLRRGVLSGVLQAEAARRGVRIRHGARLDAVEEGPGGVTAHFADGTTASGDLLIGADGLRSAVRRALDPGVTPVHAGQRVYYGYTDSAPVAPDAPEDARITMVRGSSVSLGYTVSPAGETYWFARVAGEPSAAGRHGTAAERRELLLTLLRGDTSPAAGLVAATTDDLMVTDAAEIPTGTRWRHGRALLLGDAAHAASPASGQGASMALEDAVVLAKCLRDAPDTGAAFTLYETLRRPRVEHNVTASGNISRGTAVSGAPRRGGPARSRPGDDDLIHHLEWSTDLWETSGGTEA